MINKKNRDAVSQINDYVEKNENFLIINFQKSTHIQLEELRKGLKKSNASLKVIKNTLFEKAIRDLSDRNPKYSSVKEILPLKDKTAIIALGNSWSDPLKVFFEIKKKNIELLNASAFFDGRVYQKSEVEKIASLPSRELLIGKIISSLKSPSSRIARSMKSGISKITHVLKERGKQ